MSSFSHPYFPYNKNHTTPFTIKLPVRNIYPDYSVFYPYPTNGTTTLLLRRGSELYTCV